ncbi:zinc-ribbon domain containing protein [Nitrogeniibacter aestuarii]|uniref:zinc-ribbon domain containing protein n=1 Tax=Nitrogeniibacter aestuarii TaxID=2815343 RepID=UPI001D11FF58|nr:zinc-ribbon domain containing protein [Nitrogeniibacter aestuarii]
MKSNKQRRAEIMAARRQRKRLRTVATQLEQRRVPLAANALPVDAAALMPTNSYGAPVWQTRGFYLDLAFTCKDCGAECLWTAQRQKWWYEVAKGHPDSTAVRCKPCRAKERARKETARRVAMAGLQKKMEAKEHP